MAAMDYTTAPDYLKAADLHNLGAGNTSFFDDPLSETADFVSKIPDFAITSVASGINSIYNSGVVAGNFFGITDAKENDLQQTLGSYDADLSNYYGAHKQAVDLAGFVGTSFLPGTAGIKLFQTGQKVLSGVLETGSVASTFAKGTGLVQTLTAEGKTLAQVAGEALAQGQQTFKLMDAGVLKAIGSGALQATLESAAFEAMVQATMFRSPVLDTQDIKDVGSNILTGALLGGAIGGAINAAGTYGTIKKVISAADLEQKKWTLRNSQFALPEAGDRIVVAAHDLAVTPEAVNAGEETLRSRRISDIFQEIRSNIHALVGGKDADLGNVIADTFQGADGDTIAKAFQGAAKISRPAQMGEANEGYTVGYVKLHGEGAGSASFDPLKPAQLTLADTVPGGRESILNTVKSYAAGWKAKGNLWSPKTATSMNEVEARYIWAEKLAKYTDGMTIHTDDIPLLEGALRNNLSEVKITDGVHDYVVGGADLANEVAQSKLALASELQKSKRAGWGMNAGAAPDKNVSTITSDEIARAVNVSTKRLESDEGASMFARQDAQAAYDKMRVDKKITKGESDLSFIPQHAAVAYKTEGMANANTTAVSAVTNIKQTQIVAQNAIDKAVQGIVGDLGEQLVRPGDTAIINSNRYGAGAGLVTFANGAPGTLASWAENIGAVTSRIQARLQKNTADILDSASLKLRTNQAAAIEFDKINNIVASSTEKYVLNEAGDGLIAQKLLDYQNAIKSGKKGVEVPTLQAGAPDTIPFVNPEVGDAIAARISTNGARVVHSRNLRAAQGLEDVKNENAFYPIKPQPKDYPFFAFVKDETVTGAGMGHTSMIHAASQEELDNMIKMARSKSNYSVYTKADTENFYKAQQAYEYDRTLHDNYMDAGLKSAGVNNQFFPKTDPDKIVDGWLDLERRADDVLSRETVSAKFGHEFDQLETLGQQYTNVASSRYGTTAKSIEATVQNPYNDYRKTALNISRLSEYPLLSAFNRNLEGAVDGVIQKIVNVWNESKTVNDLQKVNQQLEEAGINHAYKNAAEIVLANHSAPKPYLSSFIRGANAILSNTFLRLDPLNSLNNAIGAQVLLGSETNATVKALLRDVNGGGVTIPGTTDSVLSPAKLIGNANANYFKALQGDDVSAVANRAYYKENGWTSSIMDQHRAMLDQLSLSGAENPAQLNTRLGQAMSIAKDLTQKGEVWSGNKLAEEYNRYVAADVARQIGEARIAAGVMDTEGMTPFISTFVNRTQGNVLASQRPLIFQGPVGQAIGLFQSFQFNTMQQLFRNISEGGAKDAAMMMGLQGTMYGMNGLPGFQYINQHIIGTASGNPQHTDAYSTLYGAAGKTAGDWLMYGVPSNLLQTNIYTRGDINPRTLTVVPTNPQDIVAVSAFAKFAGNIKETVSKIAGGGDVWQSVLQGIEHNTLSRPLAGLAQTMQAIDGGKVYSTTNQGDISFVNDFFSLATLSRLAGGKPLDEALVNDEVSRAMVYKAADVQRMKAATETFKTHVIGTNPDVSPDVVHNYMDAYVHAGGQASNFNQQVMNAITKTNTPKANQVMAALKGPYADHMKTLMGQSVEDLQSAQ
jgi:hypothetical protein